MRIALVTETYPPEVNGVAMTLRRLVDGLVGRGHAVEVVRPRQKGEAAGARAAAAAREGSAEAAQSGASRGRAAEPSPSGGATELLVRGCPIPFYSALRFGFPSAGLLRRRWTEARPDVVHVATEGPLGLAALRVARGLGIPVASSFHTNFHSYSGHYGMQVAGGLALGYLRWFHNRALCTLVPTDQMCTELEALGFKEVRLLSRGVDAKLFDPARRSAELRASWGAGDGDPVVIHVGRMAAEKNLGLAVEAFLAVRAVLPRARFVLVGDGPERAELERKYPEFIYAGVRRGEDLAAHYASADLFVFPSVTETFGNVVTEAMASGLAVMAYDYAAARQHVWAGSNGFTAKYGDREDFLRMAREVAGRGEDWPAVREAARATALTISWEEIVARFERELGRLMPD